MSPDEAIEAFYASGNDCLRGLPDDVVRSLPISFLLRNINSWNWNYLPQEIKEDPRFAHLEPCLEHYNKGKIHIDGPAPSKAKCYVCNPR
jgi:hypothetical protein